jgi:hypothetical protein
MAKSAGAMLLTEKHIALRRRALARRRLRIGIGRGVGSTCHSEQSDSGEDGKHAFHGTPR